MPAILYFDLIQLLHIPAGDCLIFFVRESVTFGETFETEVMTRKLIRALVKPHPQQLVVLQRGSPPHQKALHQRMVGALWYQNRQKLQAVLQLKQPGIVQRIVYSTGFISRYLGSYRSGRGLPTKTLPSML